VWSGAWNCRTGQEGGRYLFLEDTMSRILLCASAVTQALSCNVELSMSSSVECLILDSGDLRAGEQRLVCDCG